MNLSILEVLDGFVSAPGDEYGVPGRSGKQGGADGGFAIDAALHVSGGAEAAADFFDDLLQLM